MAALATFACISKTPQAIRVHEMGHHMMYLQYGFDSLMYIRNGKYVRRTGDLEYSGPSSAMKTVFGYTVAGVCFADAKDGTKKQFRDIANAGPKASAKYLAEKAWAGLIAVLPFVVIQLIMAKNQDVLDLSMALVTSVQYIAVAYIAMGFMIAFYYCPWGMICLAVKIHRAEEGKTLSCSVSDGSKLLFTRWYFFLDKKYKAKNLHSKYSFEEKKAMLESMVTKNNS